MEKNSQSLLSAKFPIYIIGVNGKIIKENTLILFERWDGSISIVDMDDPDKTFLSRRLYLLDREKQKLLPYKLKNLKIALYLIEDVLKLRRLQHYHFVDSDGRIFKYKKTHYIPLSFHKIKWWKFIENNMRVALAFEDFGQIYYALKPPPRGHFYAGMLHTSAKGRLLFGYYTEKFDTTVRKI